MKYVYELAGQEQNKVSRKWTPVIDTFKVLPTGARSQVSRTGGGFGFDTAGEAEAAGKRAIEAVNLTGEFPNMCERY